MILLDPYANAFMRDETAAPLNWSVHDKTEMHGGVGERKWEIDSLCYPIRLAYGYWKSTGDTGPFDARWKEAAGTIVKTFRVQQRKEGRGRTRLGGTRRFLTTRWRWTGLGIRRVRWG
jgi:meiotically up-regulated gene 157 (Mug157) protein